MTASVCVFSCAVPSSRCLLVACTYTIVVRSAFTVTHSTIETGDISVADDATDAIAGVIADRGDALSHDRCAGANVLA